MVRAALDHTRLEALSFQVYKLSFTFSSHFTKPVKCWLISQPSHNPKSYRGQKYPGGVALVATKPWTASSKEDFRDSSAALWPTLPWPEFGCPEMWVFLIKSPAGGFSVNLGL